MGFAAGLGQQPGGGKPSIIGNLSANDLVLILDSQTNSLTASMELGNGILQNPKYNLEFGGEGRSAYIDGNTFAAIEAVNSDSQSISTVSETIRSGFLGLKKTTYPYPAAMQGYFVSADAIKANEVLFDGETVPGSDDQSVQKRAFCQNCSFMTWGAWGARTSYTHNGQTITNDVNLGWWIAGDVVSQSDMPTTGKATYEALA